MRKVKTNSKGEFRFGYKNWNEMTKKEREATRKYKNDDNFKYISDWYITYKHDGTLDRVQPGAYLAEYFKKDEEDNHIDIVDSMQLLYGKKHSKNYQSAKKHVGVTNDEVNVARRVIKNSEN